MVIILIIHWPDIKLDLRLNEKKRNISNLKSTDDIKF